MKITNSGNLDQAVKVIGGMKTIPAGTSTKIDKDLLKEMDGDKLDHYHRMGVVFGGMPAPCVKADEKAAAEDEKAQKKADKKRDQAAKEAQDAEDARIQAEKDKAKGATTSSPTAPRTAPAAGRGGNSAANTGK